MDAAAHNPALAKKVGVPTKVAKEYSQASKGQTFKKEGGIMKGESPVQKKAKDTAKVVKMAKGGSVDGCAIKGKTKGKMVAMAAGGLPSQASSRAKQALAARPAMPEQAKGARPFKKGGYCK